MKFLENTVKYIHTNNVKYRMYALNYLIDLALHGDKKLKPLDMALHIINELMHGEDVVKIVSKTIRYTR